MKYNETIAKDAYAPSAKERIKAILRMVPWLGEHAKTRMGGVSLSQCQLFTSLLNLGALSHPPLYEDDPDSPHWCNDQITLHDSAGKVLENVRATTWFGYREKDYTEGETVGDAASRVSPMNSIHYIIRWQSGHERKDVLTVIPCKDFDWSLWARAKDILADADLECRLKEVLDVQQFWDFVLSLLDGKRPRPVDSNQVRMGFEKLFEKIYKEDRNG